MSRRLTCPIADQESPVLDSRGAIRANHGSSTNDPILLDEDDEIIVSNPPPSTKPNLQTVKTSDRATAHPPAPGRSNLIPPDYGDIVLGPGDPPPRYPDRPNFGGPWLVRDDSDGRLPVWAAYEPRAHASTPPATEMLASGSISATPPTAVQKPFDGDMMEDMDSDEAEDLRAAIALSLQESPPIKTLPTMIHSTTMKASPSPTRREDEIKQKKKQKRDELLSKMRAQRAMEDSNQAGDTPSKVVSSATEDTERSVTLSPVAVRIQKASGSTSTSSDPTAFNLLTLNRQEMEAARLERLKRKHEADGAKTTSSDDARGRVLARREREQSKTVSLSPPPLKRGRFTDGTSLLHDRATDSKKALEREIPRSQPRESAQQAGSAAAPTMKKLPSQLKPRTIVESRRTITATSPNAQYFPTGKVFQTFVEGFPAAKTISFPQLIGPKDSLTSCLLSSFIWDFDWLLPHFATTKTKFQLVMHAKWPGQRDALQEDFRNVGNVRLCFPPMDSIINCMHSKLMLLFYDASPMEMAMAMSMPAGAPDGTPNRAGSSTSWESGPRCRIVVPTANLTGSDWGVGGVMENTVFLIDLPVKRQPSAAATASRAGDDQKTAFQKSLVAFLQAQTVPEDVISKLENFDFRYTAQYGFVHTIGGMHGGDRWESTGYCGLGRAVSQMGLASPREPEVNFVTSSVGSLNDEFLSAMYLAVQGDSGLTEYRHRIRPTARASNARNGSLKHDATLGAAGGTTAAITVTEAWRGNFHFTFPSDETVKGSTGGPAAAGTVCFSDKYWQNARFPRQNMRDCVSVRRGCLMHNKVCRRAVSLVH